MQKPEEIELKENKEKVSEYKLEILWTNVFLFGALHVGALYGLYLLLFFAQWKTVFFTFLLYQLAMLGITAGAHRLWSHKSYKAKVPLRTFLVFCNTLAFQYAAFKWARDHRVHHKFSETDADPHNVKRGFFFAHIGWLLCRRHPDLKKQIKLVDVSDLLSDPVLAFQRKYYLELMLLICFIAPTLIPMYCWQESFLCSWFGATMFRHAFTLNMVWLINSAAHTWGHRPYDKSIRPSENLLVSLGSAGEGWHNYHHVFPWDYKAAEIGNYRSNITTMFIDLMAKIGQAYDLKTVNENIISQRAKRTGDGSKPIWGFEDNYIVPEEKVVMN